LRTDALDLTDRLVGNPGLMHQPQHGRFEPPECRLERGDLTEDRGVGGWLGFPHDGILNQTSATLSEI
jgi:hypothetical protein